MNSTPIILDNGTGMIKTGFAGDLTPRMSFPNQIGLATKEPGDTSPSPDLFFNNRHQFFPGVQLRSPVQHGVVTSWDDMEKMWYHTFENVLHVSSIDHPILLTESPLNPRNNRE